MANYNMGYPQYPSFNQNGSYAVPQMYSQPSMQTSYMFTQYVDGEGAAKAFQMPPGWPVGEPIALWDMNQNRVYMKSFDSMGRPSPLKKYRYFPEEEQTPTANLPSGQIAEAAPAPAPNYVTKEDFNTFKTEILEAMKSSMQRPSPKNQGNGGGRE